MLGEPSDQKGSLGSGPAAPGPCGAGHLLRAADVAAGPAVPERRLRRVLLRRQRPGQRSSQPAGHCLLLQTNDKVSDAEAKTRADIDIRWKVALGIEAEDMPFAKSTLQVFRAHGRTLQYYSEPYSEKP